MKNKILVAIVLIAIFIGVLYQDSDQEESIDTDIELAIVAEASSETTELEQEINSFLSDLYPSEEPGISTILARGDEVLYRQGHGIANIEHNIPISPDMVFRLGSLTKQMTTAAIMMLEEDGELQVDDPITRFFPDYPTHGYTITLRHLMTHTSGIIDFLAISEFSEIAKTDLTALDVIDFFKNQPMNFAPGEAWSYTNSGYVMLGAIIEQISGQSYEEFIQERIFTPLGMNNSYHGNFKRIIPNRVTGYAMGADGLENSDYLSMTIPGAAGALISNVDDLLTWNTALFGGEVVSQESLAEMVTAFVLNNGESADYGFGFDVQTLRGQPMISHTGGINGFITYAAYLPESDMYVGVIGNTGFQSRVYEGNSLLAMAIGDPYPANNFQSVDSEILSAYSGEYQTTRGIHFEVGVDNGNLSMRVNGGSSFVLGAVAENVFYQENSFTHFEFVEGNEANTFDLIFHTNADGSRGMVARVLD
ncbi:MAG: serine hydrolase [Gammaproteobacteria bacterium]|jgi:D-alanyl-D-alanine carboxypeptidase|nr:serine hydrolase [Gammaproteobacteria bacterium]